MKAALILVLSPIVLCNLSIQYKSKFNILPSLLIIMPKQKNKDKKGQIVKIIEIPSKIKEIKILSKKESQESELEKEIEEAESENLQSFISSESPSSINISPVITSRDIENQTQDFPSTSRLTREEQANFSQSISYSTANSQVQERRYEATSETRPSPSPMRTFTHSISELDNSQFSNHRDLPNELRREEHNTNKDIESKYQYKEKTMGEEGTLINADEAA